MSPSQDRRSFLKRAALLPLLALAPKAAEAEVQPIKRVGGAELKISINAYSFTGILPQSHENQMAGATMPMPKVDEAEKAPKKKGKHGSGHKGGKSMTLFDLVDFCAAHNIDACDPTGYFFPTYPTVPPDRYVNDLKRHAFEQGVAISGTGVRNNFTTADKGLRDFSVKKIKAWIEVASRLGAPVMRVFCDTQIRAMTWHDVAPGCSREQVRDWIIADLKEVTAYGERFGVIIGVQNHGDFLQTADQLLELIQGVDSDWCGAIVDTGYFNHTSDPYAEMAKVAPYAVNWQVKQSPWGEESTVPMDMVRLLKIVRQSGYRGYLPIETLMSDPYVAVPQMVAKLKQAIAATA